MCEKFLKSEHEKTNCHQPAAVHGSSGDKERSKRVALLPLDPGSVEKISYITRLPDEILQKILTEALLSSGFSWLSHVCRTFNDLKEVSVRFYDITCRLAWTLPCLHFATGGEAGIVRVKALSRKFGPGSGAMSQKRSCMSRVEKGLSKASISRLRMVCNRKHNIEIKKSKNIS